MKKIISNAMICVLVITSIFGVMSVSKKNKQQKRINELFIENLYEADSALSIDFANADESTRICYSTRMSSNLYSAMRILNLSSYNTDNNNSKQLFSAIRNLYLCMTNPETTFIIFTEKSTVVSEYLTEIIEDINNEEACEELAKLAEELYFKK